MINKTFWKKIGTFILVCCLIGGIGFILWHVEPVKAWVLSLPVDFN